MREIQASLFSNDYSPLNLWLEKNFPEVDAHTFYRELFPEGSLEKQGEQVDGKYRGVAVRICLNKARRFSISDGLEVLEQTSQAFPAEFWLASPVSYAGRTQKQEMARFLYAVAIDLDGVRIENPKFPRGLAAMWNQISHDLQPCPTFIVSSGSGLHLYYFLEQPLALYRNVVRQLQRFRRDLIKLVWSSYVTELWEHPQYESVTQGFRMVGTYTKNGGRVRAFRTGQPVSVEYLNQWVQENNQVTDIHYKSELTLVEAKEKYPDWYQKRIVEGKPRGTWEVSRNLYEWWRDKKIFEAKRGHRYFYLMSLAIYAIKCGIPEDELYEDAFNAAKKLRLQDTPDNPLLDTDVVKALEMYNANYQTFPRTSIQYLTGVPMPPNKRNGRKQEAHLEISRAVRDISLKQQGKKWTDGNSRKGCPNKSYPKRDLIRQWREEHPHGTPKECITDTGVSKNTVYKWWGVAD